MKIRHLFWIVFPLAFGLSACATLQKPPRLDTAKACADWRWIGISRPGGRCPDVPGWTVRPLFAQAAPVTEVKDCDKRQVPKTAPDLGVIQELNRFCVYEIADPHKKLKDLPFPPAASADLVRFDKDCAALSLAAKTTSAPKAWMPEFERFLGQTVGNPRPLEINNRLGVRLAFLDTQPTGEGVPYDEPQPQHPWHGYTLTHLARQLVCAPGTDHCAAQITTRLALPILKFDPKKPKGNRTDPVRGGFVGMQSDLADAIRSEVDDWQARKLQKHLVLNLSLAWDGDLFGGLSREQIADMEAGTQAVYRALQYAAGYDVLVIAAAGNQKHAPCRNTGPLLPAAWERAVPMSCDKAQDQQLLYAVGGVGSDGEPLGNARFSGMPSRVAYAENAVVPSWKPDQPTAMLTGSSVATAVVSSIAAVVWDSFPHLDSREVMNILYNGGEPLFEADFWFDASAPSTLSARKAHRISLCTALKRACNDNLSYPCPIQGECEKWEPEASRDRVRPAPLGSCQPWLLPQPEEIPCLGCPPHKIEF